MNDAPALKKADIGIAMGSGTSVACSVSDIVILDNDLGTIIEAIKQGRSIYDNIKQFIRYLISSNIGEVVSIFAIAITGMPDVLIPVQLLWVNLVTDGLPATALGFNPPDKDVMSRKPLKKDAPIVDTSTLLRYTVIGVYVGLATVFAALYFMMIAPTGPQLSYQQITNHHNCHFNPRNLFGNVDCSVFESKKPNAIALSTLVLIEMLNALNSLSERNSLAVVAPTANKLLMLAIFSSLALHLCILNVGLLSVIIFLIKLLNFLIDCNLQTFFFDFSMKFHPNLFDFKIRNQFQTFQQIVYIFSRGNCCCAQPVKFLIDEFLQQFGKESLFWSLVISKEY